MHCANNCITGLNMKLKIISLFAIAILVEIRAKPVQESSANELKEPSNDLDAAKIDHQPQKIDRVNRQIRILIDPNDLEEGEQYDDINNGQSQNRASTRLPVKANSELAPPNRETVNIGGSGNRRPQQQISGIGGRGIIGGVISSILGSSSGRTRLVDQLMNVNQTKSEKQIEDESNNKSSEEVPDNNLTRENDESDEDDEPPGGGDGQGGGILGLLAGLSGEGGQSDLGTLLTTVASIVSNLSGGEGFDLNTLIGSAVALLGGILAGDGMKNIGAQIGGYLITALDGITGGGAMNNGAFFGNLASTLIAGSSAAGTGSNSEEGGGGGSDSGSFFVSLLSGILGGSSGRK